MQSHYQISFYVPEKQCEQVKQAMFNAGAGVLGNYQKCSWQTLGQGQFKPLEGSQPFLGKQGEIETVSEYKVEMLCTEENIKPVIQALKSSHPYEVPAYFVTKTMI
ncbi:MAG: divalent cation tolerance protein CutA [Cocleimonas sp.]|nr:divalent cation tolerance protein CutA [Cocleimonas sp.]